jgi:hypothetical protein
MTDRLSGLSPWTATVPYVEFRHWRIYLAEASPLALDEALIRPRQLTHWRLSTFLGSEPVDTSRSLT